MIAKDGDTLVVHGVTYVADENAPRDSRMYVDLSMRPIRCGDVVVESGPVCIVSPRDLDRIAWLARMAERTEGT